MTSAHDPKYWKRALRVPIMLAMVTLAGCNDYSDEEWAQFRSLVERESATNATVSIPFDPETTAIVSDSSDQRLLTDYAVDRLYRRGTADNRPAYLVERVGAASHCDDEGLRPVVQRIGGSARKVFGPPVERGVDNAIACVVTLPGAPSGGILRVDHLEETTEIDDLPVIRVTMIITDAAGKRYRLRALRPSLGNEDYRSMPASVLARALAVPRRPIPSAPLAAAIDAQIAQAEGSMLATDRMALEQVLATPTATAFSQDHFPAISASAERAAPYAARAVAALGQAAEAGESGRIGGYILTNFVAGLPSESIKAEGAGLLAAFDRPEPPQWLLEDALMTRLGELGPDALPVVSDLVARDRHLGALTALCQIATPATPAMRTLLLERWQKANQRRTETRRSRRRRSWLHRMITGERRRTYTYTVTPVLGQDSELLYITMIRLGLRADADRLAMHRRVEEWRENAAAISPRSPATICTSDIPRLDR